MKFQRANRWESTEGYAIVHEFGCYIAVYEGEWADPIGKFKYLRKAKEACEEHAQNLIGLEVAKAGCRSHD